MECNILLNTSLAGTIAERRELAHQQLRRKYDKELAYYDYSSKELAEFGYTLRTAIETGLQQKKLIADRLAWPYDPDYDRKALERTNFDD